jgi:hypothetical protein
VPRRRDVDRRTDRGARRRKSRRGLEKSFTESDPALRAPPHAESLRSSKDVVVLAEKDNLHR